MRRTLPARLGRFALGALVTTTVVGLVLAIPVISGAGAPAVELDSSSTAAPSRDRNSPVIMGMDGRPVSSADFAGVTTSGAAPSSSAAASTTSGTAVAAAPADPAEAPATESESVDAPAPGTTAGSPAGTPAPGGTPAGTSSASTPRQPTSSAPAPAPAPAPSPDQPAESPVEVSNPAAEVLALVNAERAALGCGALVPDAGLAATAQAHSAAMSGSGLLGLDGLVGAVAQGADASSVVAGWISDPAGAALLDCSRTSTGIAVVDGWWTALVA
jgi:uncharacterized protein YkwD